MAFGVCIRLARREPRLPNDIQNDVGIFVSDNR